MGDGARAVRDAVAQSERLGWSVEAMDRSYRQQAGVAIVIRGHKYAVELHELTEAIPFAEAEIDAWLAVAKSSPHARCDAATLSVSAGVRQAASRCSFRPEAEGPRGP